MGKVLRALGVRRTGLRAVPAPVTRNRRRVRDRRGVVADSGILAGIERGSRQTAVERVRERSVRSEWDGCVEITR